VTAYPEHRMRFTTAVIDNGHTYRVALFEDDRGECTCQRGHADCEHVQHARRLRDNPCRLALEHIVMAWPGLPSADHSATVHQLATEALLRDDQRMTLQLARDTRPLTERAAEAVDVFSRTSSAWQPAPRLGVADIDTTNLGGSTR